jgi:hypothetical protein
MDIISSLLSVQGYPMGTRRSSGTQRLNCSVDTLSAAR